MCALTHLAAIVDGAVKARWAGTLPSMVLGIAGGWFFAWFKTAGTFTPLVDAAAVIWAGIIGDTANGNTLCTWVALRARRAVANSLVFNSLTDSCTATRLIVGSTHWCTLPIPTCMCSRTVVISIASNFNTPNFWITFIAPLACTHWMVLNNFTISIGTTLAWIPADTSEASLF